MDTRQLKEELKPFIEICKQKGKPLKRVVLEENVPGLPAAQYHLLIQAEWLNPEDDCDGHLDELVDWFIETVDPKVRSFVQFIRIQDKLSRDHCFQELIVFDSQNAEA